MSFECQCVEAARKCHIFFCESFTFSNPSPLPGFPYHTLEPPYPHAYAYPGTRSTHIQGREQDSVLEEEGVGHQFNLNKKCMFGNLYTCFAKKHINDCNKRYLFLYFIRHWGTNTPAPPRPSPATTGDTPVHIPKCSACAYPHKHLSLFALFLHNLLQNVRSFF